MEVMVQLCLLQLLLLQAKSGKQQSHLKLCLTTNCRHILGGPSSTKNKNGALARVTSRRRSSRNEQVNSRVQGQGLVHQVEKAAERQQEPSHPKGAVGGGR
jgi:hypothetical protein